MKNLLVSEIVDCRLMVARYGELFCLTRQDPYHMSGLVKCQTIRVIEVLAPNAKTPESI
jgi:hypothetical protein